MEVAHATIWLKNVSMRQLLHAGGVFDPFSHMSAFMTNVETALQVRPVGLQYCVTSSKGVRIIQGLKGEAPFLYARLWEPHIEILRQKLTFRDNRSSFVFLSLTGQEIQAQIRLFAETGQDVGAPTDITQTMEMLLEAFDRGIALFMPTVTAEGIAITTNTRLVIYNRSRKTSKGSALSIFALGMLQMGFQNRGFRHCKHSSKTTRSAWLCL